MDILLIPCWARPELLYHTLDNLVNTGDLSTVHIVFKPDTAHSAEIYKVVDLFKDHLPSYEFKAATPSKNKATKQSQNVLEGYIYAASLTDGLVFMVEEDVMVGEDFFRYHRALHDQQPDLFCSLSTRNHNRAVTTEDDPAAYYLSTGDYCSLGVCFKASVIREHIAPHVNSSYLADPIGYCEATFPNSEIGRSMVEQDGLIRRIQMSIGLPTAYPHAPRAYHAGYYGYNRDRNTFGGSLQAKIDRVGEIIYDREAMRKAVSRPEYFRDSEPVPLKLSPWKTLHLKPV